MTNILKMNGKKNKKKFFLKRCMTQKTRKMIMNNIFAMKTKNRKSLTSTNRSMRSFNKKKIGNKLNLTNTKQTS